MKPLIPLYECPDCFGMGQISDTETCSNCSGRGEVTADIPETWKEEDL